MMTCSVEMYQSVPIDPMRMMVKIAAVFIEGKMIHGSVRLCCPCFKGLEKRERNENVSVPLHRHHFDLICASESLCNRQ